MNFTLIESKEKWNNFVYSSPSTTILQSWEWGETKRAEGWEPLRYALTNNGDIEMAALVQFHSVPFLGTVLYIAHGPVLKISSSKEENAASWNIFLNGLLKIAKERNAFLIEIEPMAGKESEDVGVILSHSLCHVSGRNRQPRHRLIVDCTKSEEEMLASMSKSTRRNIKLAEKAGVVIKKYSFDDPDIKMRMDAFYELMLLMQKRAGGYPIRPRSYFKRLVSEFKDADRMMLVEAHYENTLIAANISEFTDVWASSFYAGSNRLHTEAKAPYLLRWASMLEAKARGVKTYDFWGIMPGSAAHKGYTDMKLSFGGTEVDTAGIIEIVVNKKKNILFKILRRLKIVSIQ